MERNDYIRSRKKLYLCLHPTPTLPSLPDPPCNDVKLLNCKHFHSARNSYSTKTHIRPSNELVECMNARKLQINDGKLQLVYQLQPNPTKSKTRNF